jgi:hypothetical protein
MSMAWQGRMDAKIPLISIIAPQLNKHRRNILDFIFNFRESLIFINEIRIEDRSFFHIEIISFHDISTSILYHKER